MFRNARKWAKCGFKWVFGSTRKPLGNRSAFGTCHDNSWWWRGGKQFCLRSCCSFFVVLQTKWWFLGSLKATQLILVSKIILTDPYVTSRDLHGRKPYKFGVQVNSSRLCSMRALGSTQRNHFMQTSLSKVCSMYWQKYKSQIVGLCSFNNF